MGLTLNVMSLVVDSSPSLAVARSTYVPGTEKSALVTALPSGRPRMGSEVSKVTFAGPRYCIQVTFRPSLGRLMEVFVCALPGSEVGHNFRRSRLRQPVIGDESGQRYGIAHGRRFGRRDVETWAAYWDRPAQDSDPPRVMIRRSQ